MGWEDSLLAPEERVLSTLEKDGSRRWLYPRLSPGRFWKWRLVVGWGLIALFVSLPFISINAHPAILLDILKRDFHLFGAMFRPTDTIILALLLLTIVLGVLLITALFGRVWCGWGCPQSVYMELVFRPLERLFFGRRGVGGRPTAPVAVWRRLGLYLTYLAICFVLANVFLAYFVGVERLGVWITRSPVEHPTPFLTMIVVTGLMYFDFAYFREQTCIIACPYGRLQGALVDRDSLVIAYDTQRGEPRGRRKAGDVSGNPGEAAGNPGEAAGNPGEAAGKLDEEPGKGHCIDCSWCVAVCPTGIDIRKGLQIECIGCAQCIDACDAIMDKVGTPRGLVRYSSQNAIAGARSRILRPRLFVYSGVMVVMLVLLSLTLSQRAMAELNVSRNVGRPFVVNGNSVENVLRVKTTNRTSGAVRYGVSILGPEGVVVANPPEPIELEGGAADTSFLLVLAPVHLFVSGGLDVQVRITGNDGTIIEKPFRLLGPTHATPSPRGQP